ncbi:MAG: MFS transporter [SAR202 cluster bacterium]|nr:MFS transporter [SAR202 cluster bacterium]MDP6514680.1 MFS transporter [SAR202 cluster bacterium]MDP6714830.1 MFS transporter [SAR202 cluster bacterium]
MSSETQMARKRNRTFILSSMSTGHGIAHLFDQGIPVLMPTISSSFGLSDIQVSVVLAFRFAGFGIVNLGGGLVVDMLKRYWGMMLAGCMFSAGIFFALVGVSPNFPILLITSFLASIPGALWHLPSAASLSQLFPDRRGWAISIHGFGANIGNVAGPIMAAAILGLVGSWRSVLFIYAVPAVMMGVFVWWSLRDIGKEGDDPPTELSAHLRDTWGIMKNPVVLLLVLAAILRGIGLDAVFAWSPFYLEETLGKGHLSAGFHYSLLTGMGIISAPIMGLASDRFGRKVVLVPGFLLAAGFSLLTVFAGEGFLLMVVFAGMGLFSFALHQVIQAAVLDVVGQGTEATAVGLIFGINGILGAASPFLGFLVIDNFGGYGAVYYYAGILTALSALLTIFAPMKMAPRVGAATS